MIDNSVLASQHKDISFALKLKTPALVPAGGENWQSNNVLAKPSIQDMSMFDKQEDLFAKKLDILHALSLENRLSVASYQQRTDKLVIQQGAQDNPEKIAYVKLKLA